MLTADVRTGKTQILTEEIAEEEARLNGSAVPRAIDDDFDGDDRAHEARIVTQVTTGNDRSRWVTTGSRLCPPAAPSEPGAAVWRSSGLVSLARRSFRRPRRELP